MSEDTEAPEFIEISLTAEQAKGFIDQLQYELERLRMETEMLRTQLKGSKANEQRD